eukprot:TRINITY_DN1536_c0_g1_i1.p1 TRINITY_DN1536_c0_g1~~TRINITY_DN1536_c0_g1_i1.p1  ORF type:complete len:468 (+),score=105.61 TRINITY_DN1536_c0_g1_i1:73-1476(+)
MALAGYPSATSGETTENVKTTSDDDALSTDGGLSEEATVARKLVEIPREQGLENVSQLLSSDMLNRYQVKKPELNFLLQSERFFAQYLGMKYACALNSGGIAITLGLEGMMRVFYPYDKKDQIRVYSNAFTFHAVPSACVEAGFRETLKLVEATDELVIDLDHLEQCIKEDLSSGRFAEGKMILVLSYMRGRVPDMHRVMDLCSKYNMQLLEDSAHGYGCSFAGKMCGSFGVVSTISTQANKLVNTGEGGMIFTNNDDLQAFFIFSAGSYEELWRKHDELAPPEEVALRYKYTCSNKSVRMTNLQAALMWPQLKVMGDRIEQHNSMYYHLVTSTFSSLEKICGVGSGQRIQYIPQAHKLVGPVYDSLQIRILTKDGTKAPNELEGLNRFLKAMQDRKYSIAKFSDVANARNYLSWQYLKQDDISPASLPRTTRALANVCDLRLLCHDTEPVMEKMAADIADCFKLAF